MDEAEEEWTRPRRYHRVGPLLGSLASCRPRPQLGGTLGGTPLSDLLIYALDRRLTGTPDRARVLRRSGDTHGAYREFKSIADQDGSTVEAREVRSYEMRRGKRPEDPKPSRGLDHKTGKGAGQIFGRLFKR